ncbi:STAS domain-containing protein [Kitasatospora kifunensis]|uniref:Anti-sigma factor antagonist n=1 Tax=Kitasatospora kifunensis TaxID=58351 RepID=A0A7W7R894_KITKI|nr:STAS domain-containing protein [Kitasatospora kifunensis]MBB4927201.1 anti-anti-sigma factor [Kitasatospora kifunensis]
MRDSVPAQGRANQPPGERQRAPRLTTEVRATDGIVVVCPVGELDYDSAALLRVRLREAIGAAAERVVVDCHGLSFCDSTGLNTLLTGRLEAQQANITLILADLQATVARVFELTGTDAVFDIRPDVHAAVCG